MWTGDGPLENQAAQQLLNTARKPFIFKYVAVMPNVHFGMGATVGSVLSTEAAIISDAVGVDIECELMASQLTLSANDLPESLVSIHTDVERAVPNEFVTMRGRALVG